MKIGLVRHFEVAHQPSSNLKLMTPTQLKEWLHEYELSDVKDCLLEPDKGIWETCYSSDLPRAIKTAQKLFAGEIIETKALRELPIFPPTNINFKLPVVLWLFLGRIAWMLSHKSQVESKAMLKERVKYIVDEIILKNDQDILIVSHGFLMIFLRKELLKQGFRGPNFKKAVNGEIYVFEQETYT
ncbi:histidine phosphatase family protein [Propionispora hippei]|uniref:Broad specificity phosphatase PhoE n=1 Tax=Propionispora hippei DSM 15287 TaxID=1123003 RepID=A0A1M6IE27_9FIRM|nr:histidine phosphatase family protein [Propionispora hippei]SHJ32546.1 Broad specificity phosphatase PhoE [Propionispora hippei DSM 15287]